MFKWKSVVFILLCFFFLEGCSFTEKAVETSTIIIKDDGSVTDVIIDDFDVNKYDLEELRNMAEEELSEYAATTGADRIVIENMEIVDTKIQLKMNFQNYEDFSAYNDTTLFIGTLTDAYKEGYDLDIVLQNAKDKNETLVKEDLMKMGLSNVVIAKYDGIIRCPGKVLYYSQGAEYTDSLEVDGLSDALTYVIYK